MRHALFAIPAALGIAVGSAALTAHAQRPDMAPSAQTTQSAQTSDQAARHHPDPSDRRRHARPITERQVRAAQDAWCASLLSVSRAYERGGRPAATRAAQRMLDRQYAFDEAKVLFKPTMSSGDQTFRFDEAGALSYFVAGNPAYPNDTGFALKGWTKCVNHIADVSLDGPVGATMAKVEFTNADGVTVVDKTFAFRTLRGGAVKVVVHHSSLPYSPAQGGH